MKKVTFLQVGMENFGPYQEPLVYDIANNTLTLIVGPNGVGKTMSLEAIPFTFYGITTKGARGDDVVNNIVEKNCRTWVQFTVDSDEYLATRYHKYEKIGNTVTLDKNGQTILKGHREVTPFIENLVMPRKLFMNTRMFGQKVKDFFTDLVDSERKDIFRMVIQLDNYVQYYENAKNELSQIDGIITNLTNSINVQEGIKNSILDTIETEKEKERIFKEQKEKKILELKGQIDINRRLLEKWEATIEELKALDLNIEPIVQELTEARTELKQFNDKVSVKIKEIEHKQQEKISELKAQSDQQKMAISKDSREKIAGLNSQVQEQNQKLQNIQKKSFELISTFNQQLAKAEEAIIYSENEISELSVALGKDGGQCPTCLQEITDDAKGHLQEEINKLNQKIETSKSLMEEVKDKKKVATARSQSDADGVHIQIKQIRNEIKLIEAQEQKDLDDNEIKLNELISQVQSMASEWTRNILKESGEEKEKLLQKEQILLSNKSEMEKKIEELNIAEKNHLSVTNTIIDLNSKLDDTKGSVFDKSNLIYSNNKIKKIEEKILEIGNEIGCLTGDSEVVTFWKKGFSPTGIPSMLIDDAIPFMNKRVSEYLDRISNGRYLVAFDTLDETKSGQFRDKISVKVLDTHTHANSRVQLSGGQTRLVDIATILTLGDLQEEIQDVSFNILMFDEIFDSLDDENIIYVSKVLRQLTTNERALFIISHRHIGELDADVVYNLT